jgi:glycosyltransferase involved in cell wall biosynthesis
MGKNSKTKVAFVFTHEIQYFTNVLDELHHRGNVDLLSIYANHTQAIIDPGFNRTINWDNRPAPCFPSVVLANRPEKFGGRYSSTWCRGIFRELSRYDPDVVHLNGYSAVIQWLAWLWAVMHRKAIIVRGDGDTLGGARKSGGTRLGRLLARLFTSRARHVFFQGVENKGFWMQRGAKPEAMSWIPCVPDNLIYRKSEFTTAEERQRFRAEAGAGAHETVFLVSGKLDARKRPQDAIEVISKLKDMPCRIWFLGSGPLEKSLQKLAGKLCVSERIHWWGFRNQTEIPKILQASDVLLHPSQQDPWPYSVLEGAMSGLALLLSNQTGSHPDLISRAGAGLIFKCGDLDDLSRVMRQFAFDAEKRAVFRAAAQATSLQYTETCFCEIMEEALLKLNGMR